MRDKDIAKHPLTHPGRSSFEALFGRPPRLAFVASRLYLIVFPSISRAKPRLRGIFPLTDFLVRKILVSDFKGVPAIEGRS